MTSNPTPDLHAAIMNIPCRTTFDGMTGAAYKEGHRDARHAAAELVNAAQSIKPDSNLRDAVLAWWNDHQYDTTGGDGEDDDERNLFETEPEFVRIAKDAK